MVIEGDWSGKDFRINLEKKSFLGKIINANEDEEIKEIKASTKARPVLTWRA